MAVRADFGGTASDYTYDTLGGLVRVKGGTLTFWTARTGGSKHTDLVHLGQSVTEITVGNDGQIPVFQGPAGVVVMWADDGNEFTERVMIVAMASVTQQAAASAAEALDAADDATNASQGVADAAAQVQAVISGALADPTDASVAGRINNPETLTSGAIATTSPEQHGALGNNAAADTAGLRSALAFLKVIELKPGRTYTLDSPLTLNGQRLVGNGATIKRANQISTTTTTTVTSGATTTITVASTAGFRVGQSVMLVNGSNFDTSNRVISAVGGSTITVSTSFGIAASGTSTVYLAFNTLTLTGGSVVDHLNIDGNKANWTFNRWQNTSEIVTVGNHNRVVGVKANNCPGEGSVVYGDHNVIRDSAFTNVNGNGVHFSGASHPVCDNVTVIAANLDTTVGHADGCIIWSNLTSHATISNCYTEGGISGIGSIDSTDNSDVTITGNTIRNATQFPIEIVCPNTDPTRIIITGNRIYSNANTPVSISNPAGSPTVFPGQVIFSNNYLSGPAGIILLSMARVKKATVEGNHFDLAAATTGSCLSIGECAGVNVRGNTFTGGAYGIVINATPGGLLGGNQFFNQNLGGVNCTADAGFSQLIIDNYITNDNTAAASYNGILARDKHVVRGNYVELIQGRSGIYAINGALIRENTVKHGTATYSIRSDGGSTGIRFLNNDVSIPISNAGGAGNVDINDAGAGPANPQTAAYTLVLNDAGRAVEVNSASTADVTVPPASSVAWPIGSIIEVARLGVGSVTVQPGAGVTIQSGGGLRILRAQFSTATLRYRGSDTWLLAGDLA